MPPTETARSLLRMFLETVEDVERGHAGKQHSKSGMRIPRHTMAIEHLLPQRWRTNWPVDGGLASEIRRDEHVHRLGNLTLLTTSLNSTVSNAAWHGANSKRAALHKHDVILLNRQIRDEAQTAWTEDDIDGRTQRMLESLMWVWPCLRATQVRSRMDRRSTTRASTSEPSCPPASSPSATLLSVGSSHRTSPRLGRREFCTQTARSSPPRQPPQHLRGRESNGWWYFRVADGRTLRDVRREHARSLMGSTTEAPSDT